MALPLAGIISRATLKSRIRRKRWPGKRPARGKLLLGIRGDETISSTMPTEVIRREAVEFIAWASWRKSPLEPLQPHEAPADGQLSTGKTLYFSGRFLLPLLPCGHSPCYHSDAGGSAWVWGNVALFENSPARQGGVGCRGVAGTPPSRVGLSTNATMGACSWTNAK